MKQFWGTIITFAIAIMTMTGGASINVSAQRAVRVNNRQVADLLRQIERDTDVFSRDFEVALDRSDVNGTQYEDDVKEYIVQFESATDRLKERFESNNSVISDVEDVLNRAAYIDYFLRDNGFISRSAGRTIRNRYEARVATNWTRVSTDLRTLAGYYNVRYALNRPSDYGSGVGTGRGVGVGRGNGAGNGLARLGGTYQLDASRSQDIEAEIDRASVGLNVNQRERVRRQALRRLTAPEYFAIERSGRQITLASSNSQRLTFEADGRTRTETLPNGRTTSVNTTIYGEQLVINYTGDRVNDYYVAFNPTGNGDTLRVTRRIYLENLDRQVSVDSVYTRTSPVADFNRVYDRRGNAGFGSSPNRNPNRNDEYQQVDGFVVPNGTQLVAVLQNDLDTRQAQSGDLFTMEVRSPSEYNGAIIEGRVSNVERSGRVSGRARLSLDFDRIRLRDGRSYNFAGLVRQIRPTDDANVQINNEGEVREGDNQTTRTATRAGVGAALGAIIGAIAGGGSGAAIGAGVGAGAGAGSVVLQGRDDLQLKAGTEVSIDASAPRNTATRTNY